MSNDDCKLINNEAKLKIALYSFLMVWGLFVIFAHPSLFQFTRPVFKTASYGLFGVVGHGFLAGLIAGVITYMSMDPGEDRRSCIVDPGQ